MARERHRRRGAEKKLTDAVLFWAQRPAAKENKEALDEDAKVLGLPAAMVEDLEADGSEDFDLWEENEPALRWFLALATAWRVSPLGAVLGLDYPAAEVVARMMRLETTPALFADLQAAERAAVKLWRSEPPASRRPRSRRRPR